jgi:hypothetical protein
MLKVSNQLPRIGWKLYGDGPGLFADTRMLGSRNVQGGDGKMELGTFIPACRMLEKLSPRLGNKDVHIGATRLGVCSSILLVGLWSVTAKS